MKKCGAMLLVGLVAVLLTACNPFYADETQTLTSDDNTATIFVQLNSDVVFDIGLFIDDPDSLIQQIKQKGLQDQMDRPDGIYVTDAWFDEDQIVDHGDSYLYTLKLKIANYPAQIARATTRPFTITHTYTIFNPLNLMPANENFAFCVGLVFKRRMSTANTMIEPERDDDGNYLYLWTTTGDIVVTRRYPNRTLYYVIAVVIAVVVGVTIFLAARNKACKNHIEKL